MANESEKHENTVVFLVAPGDVLDGRWLIETPIGHGAMGRVYAAEHVVLGRRVAIKVLEPRLARDADATARFVEEAQSKDR